MASLHWYFNFRREYFFILLLEVPIRYNTLEQLECQLEQIIGMYNLETYKNELGNTRKNKEI